MFEIMMYCGHHALIFFPKKCVSLRILKQWFGSVLKNTCFQNICILQAAILFKKEIFCEFTKFLRTSFLQNTSGKLIASDISILGFSKIKLIKILSRYFYLIQAQFFHYKKPIDLFTVQINWVVSIS